MKPPPSASSRERKIIRLKSKSESLGASDQAAIKTGVTKLTASSSATVSSSTETTNKQKAELTKVVPTKGKESVAPPKPIKIKRHSFGSTQSTTDSDKVTNDIVTSTTDIKTSSEAYTRNPTSDTDSQKPKVCIKYVAFMILKILFNSLAHSI